MPQIEVNKNPVTIQSAIASNFTTAAPALVASADNVAFQSATVPAQSLTTSDPVNVTGGPRAMGAFIDVTNYPSDGANVAVALQLDFGGGNGFETVIYFTTTERGFMADGVTPAVEAGATIKTPFPFPDCTARIIIISDQDISTKAVVRF